MALMVACGYRMPGRGNLPGDLQHFAIHVLENRTSETGVETLFTNGLVNEFNTRRPGTLVESDRAPAFLEGSIASIGSNTIARSGSITALERRVFAVISVNLIDRQGQVLWQSGPLRSQETYIVAENDSTTERRKRQAIAELADRLAENVIQRMTDDF